MLFILFILLITILLISKARNHNKPQAQLPYKPKKILSEAEQSFYLVMSNYITDAAIFPKVGLKEFLYIPGQKNKEYMSHWARISQKHVDFLICDKKTMYIYCVVELDDKSHERQSRVERDKFIDDAMEQAGIPIVHIRCKSGYEKNDFQSILSIIEN